MYKLLIVAMVLSSCAYNNTRVTIKAISAKRPGVVYTRTDITSAEDANTMAGDLAEEAMSMAAEPAQTSVLVCDVDKKEEMASDVIKDKLSSIGYRVTGYNEISYLISNETRKDILGCNDVQCYAEIGMALNVDYLIVHRAGAAFGLTQSYDVRLPEKNEPESDSMWQGTVGGILLFTTVLTIAAWGSEQEEASKYNPSTQNDAYQSANNEVNHKAYGIALGSQVLSSIILFVWESND